MVKVRKHGCATKFNAKVLAVGHEVRARRHARMAQTHAPRSRAPCWIAGAAPCGPFASCANAAAGRLRLPPTPPPRRPACAAPQCDIAMLTVEDDEFWSDVEALDINGLPAMQARAAAEDFRHLRQ